jgi:hypothetical protein
MLRMLLFVAALLGASASQAQNYYASPQYEGLVSTRNQIAKGTQSALSIYATAMGRTAHVATENLNAIKVVFGNFYINSNVPDQGNSAAATITASIEYPAGTCTQIKFNGSASVTIPNINVAFSDYTTTSIPSGATYWIREWWSNPNGVLANLWNSPTLGDQLFINGSGATPDQTVSCTTVIGNFTQYSIPQLAIIGHTINPSVIVVGDSLGWGNSDIIADPSSNQVGTVVRSFGTSLPFLNLSVGGEAAGSFIANSPARQQVLTYGSHLVSEFGANDFFVLGNTTAAQVEASLQTVYALARPGQKIFQTTITPHTLSATKWISPDDQTQYSSAQQAGKVTLNSDIRALLLNTVGEFDIASIVGIGTNNQDWQVPAAAVTVTFTSGGSTTVNGTNSFNANDTVVFADSGGTLPIEISPATLYYVVAATGSTFTITATAPAMEGSVTVQGTPIAFSHAGSGTMTAQATYSPDGLHMTPKGYQNLQNSGIILPSMFVN